MQYGQQDAYGQQVPYAQGIYSPGGTYAAPPAAGQYVDPSYAASPAAMYGPQPYATDAYGQPVMPSPSNAVMSPMTTYDPGYANYMYGMPPPRSPRRYVIQSPRRRSAFNTDSILTVLIVCGTLFLVFLAMLLIVTVVVPRLARRSHSGHRARRHEFPNELENLADAEFPVDVPQMSPLAKADQTDSKLNSAGADHGSKHGKKDPEMARHVKSRTKG
ncbi:uncharacterized protein LOC119407007 [Rhipicephalus sanguineus]|uniref:uncharacterized protein LOC119407007 n=1 Tax=Rhipicephalus sanguineus TaxID=34632 RepID=UPI00189575A0|nr:uncharacterized protein LOC119407007 [Rhipicephalus sanguineus]